MKEIKAIITPVRLLQIVEEMSTSGIHRGLSAAVPQAGGAIPVSKETGGSHHGWSVNSKEKSRCNMVTG